jgi:putative FmdB family regulatory protein
MAIFDFTCRSCDTTFEFMTRGDRQPICPSCGGAELRKHFSAPAIHGHGHGSFAAVDMGVLGVCDTKEKYDRACQTIKERFPGHSVVPQVETAREKQARLEDVRHSAWQKENRGGLDSKLHKEIKAAGAEVISEAKEKALKQNLDPGKIKPKHELATKTIGQLVGSK